jgi:hypothetical protein
MRKLDFILDFIKFFKNGFWNEIVYSFKYIVYAEKHHKSWLEIITIIFFILLIIYAAFKFKKHFKSKSF